MRWVALLSVAWLTACGGVTPIGSGDAPTAKAGSTGMSSGGMLSVGDGGTGAGSMGAGTSLGGAGTGPNTSAGAAGKDPGMGGITQTEGCKNDADCSDGSVPCEECADGSYACNKPYCSAGKCAHTGEKCPAGCLSERDCPVLGLACTECGDGSKSCPSTQCRLGKCVTSFPGCHSVDPCKGLACGTQCKQCADGKCDPNVPLYCGADGKCEPGIPQCGAGVKCGTPRDCGAPPPDCVSCSATTCAGYDCVDGACVFECPSNPDPQCQTTLNCPATDVCKMCADRSCARRVCWKGNCELACEP